jgi:hypothetical protein
MNSQDGVTIAPPEGVHDSAIGYGIVIGFHPAANGNVNLQRDTGELISRLQSTNAGMRVGQRSRSTTIGGRRGLVTTLYSNSPYAGQTETDALVTVEHPQGLFYILSIAPQSDFRRLEGTFEDILKSIRFNG